jgi:SSS family solute:Na+ symporter
MIETGGWKGMVARIHQNFPGQDFTHMWAPLSSFDKNPMGINWIGIVFGLAMVQSMGYWTTDFLVVQRVLSAKDIRSAKMAPIIGSFFKMAVPLIVILPGLLGLAVLPMHLVPNSPHLAAGQHSYNEVLPLMLARYCGPGLLGLGITALVAGFMAGMAGNVSAFATVWTYDIYRPYLHKTAPDHHYVSMGRWCTMIGLFISIGTAYLVMGFASIMDYVQALFGFFIAPLFGTVLLGMLWKRVTRWAGFLGLLAGTLSSITMFLLMQKVDPQRWVPIFARSPLAKGLAQDMYQSLWACVTCVVVTVLVTLVTKPKPDAELVGLVYSLTPLAHEERAPLLQRPLFWGIVALAILAILQIIFW